MMPALQSTAAAPPAVANLTLQQREGVAAGTTGTGIASPATQSDLSARQAAPTVSPAAALPFDDVLAAAVPKLRPATSLKYTNVDAVKTQQSHPASLADNPRKLAAARMPDNATPKTTALASNPTKPVLRHNSKPRPASADSAYAILPQEAACPTLTVFSVTVTSLSAVRTGVMLPDLAQKLILAQPEGLVAAAAANEFPAPGVEQTSSSGVTAAVEIEARPSGDGAAVAARAIAATSLVVASVATAGVVSSGATAKLPTAYAPANAPPTDPPVPNQSAAAMVGTTPGSAPASEPSPIRDIILSSTAFGSHRLAARQASGPSPSASVTNASTLDQGSSNAANPAAAQDMLTDANGTSSRASPDRLWQDNMSRLFGQSEPVADGPGFSIDSRLLGPVSAALTPADMIGSRLHVQFTVDRPATAALIASGVDQLDRTLSATGIGLGSLAVAIGAHVTPGAPQPDPQHAMLVTRAELSSPLAPPSTESTGSLATASSLSQGSASGDAAPGAGAWDFRREQQHTPRGETSPIRSQAIAAPTRDRFA